MMISGRWAGLTDARDQDVTPDKRATLLRAFLALLFAGLLVFGYITSGQWLAAMGLAIH